MILQLNAGLKETSLLYTNLEPRYSFVTLRQATKLNVIFSTYLPNQEVLEYPLEYASILRLQKLYLVHLVNSTRHDYLALVQFDLVGTYSYSRQGLWLVFLDLHVVHQVDIDICINHLQVARFLLDMFGLVGRCLV